jgi:hypothetical protein
MCDNRHLLKHLTRSRNDKWLSNIFFFFYFLAKKQYSNAVLITSTTWKVGKLINWNFDKSEKTYFGGLNVCATNRINEFNAIINSYIKTAFKLEGH